MAIARIAYTQQAPVSIHGSSKRFRELVMYRERTPISSVSRVRKSYNDSCADDRKSLACMVFSGQVAWVKRQYHEVSCKRTTETCPEPTVYLRHCTYGGRM